MGGGASSTPISAPYMGRSEAEIVNLMMPVWFTRETDVTGSELVAAKNAWQSILDDKAPGFLLLKGTPGFDHATCISLFYDSFYSRLFDVHPMCRPMFKSGMKSQGKFLIKMISLALSRLDQDDKFNETLVKLTNTHNERGVKAIEYGIVGEVLFWTLKRCLGPGYDAGAHMVWVKVLSRMLKIMVPVAVSFEISSGGQAQKKRASESRQKSDSGGSRKDSEVIEEKYGSSAEDSLHSNPYVLHS